MSERLRTLIYALVALAALAALMFGRPEADDGYRPLGTESNVSGLLALKRWLEVEGIRVETLADDWSTLPEATGNVLLTHSPPRRIVSTAERRALHAWVREGNRLVVADFGNEEFAPSRISSLAVLQEQAPGLLLEDRAARDPLFATDRAPPSPFEEVPLWVRALGGLEARTLEPAGGHPLTAHVERLEVIGDLHGHRWRQRRDGDFPWLPLLRDAASFGEVAWVRSFGEGEIVLVLHPSLFSNGALGRADNALLARDLLAPAGSGALLLDDHHQTAAGPGAGGRLLADPRLHATVAALLVFWLLWLLADDGAWERRVRPRPAPVRRRADLVRAVGNFLARHMDQAQAAERLVAPVRARLALRHGVAESEAFAKLAEEPAIDAARRRAWEQILDRMRHGRRVRLTTLRAIALDTLERLA